MQVLPFRIDRIFCRILCGAGLLTALLMATNPAQAQTFVATGAMQVPRYGHTAVLLKNGDVLLAGGSDGTSLLTSAEIYDPRSGTFHLTGSMHTARRDATGALLPDGDVLIAGGHDALGQPLRSAEIYDPKTGWFYPAGDLQDALDSIVAYRLKDGDIAVLGKSGCSTTESVCTDSVEIFDPGLRSFLRAGDLPDGSGSWGFGTAQLNDGEILVIGGYLPVGTAAVQSAELVDADHRFSYTVNGLTVVDELKPATVTLPDDTVLIAGGSHHSAPATIAELYHPDAGDFTFDGMSNSARIEHLTLLHDHDVLATGGGDGFDAAELYHMASHSFHAIAPMLTGHSGDTITLLPDGRVLIAGGVHYAGPFPMLALSQPSAELFVPFWFGLRPGVKVRHVDDDRDWTAFTIHAFGHGADGTRIKLTCHAKHLDCDAWPDDVALGGHSYVIVHGLRGYQTNDIPVWVQGTAGGETKTIRLTIEK